MHEKNYFRRKKLSKSLITGILLVAMLLQTLSLFCFAAEESKGGYFGSMSGLHGPSSGIGKFESDAVIAQLKKDFLKSINKDLLVRVEDYELSGEVDVIITFSDNSLINEYSKSAEDITYAEYRETTIAKTLKNRLEMNQMAVLERLSAKRLITCVNYNYYHVFDGASVTTTYEQLKDICEIEGVERVIIADTYKPAVAVENPVNVYDTGIFNSGDVSYTGKGTIVAVLDTGCDYTHTAFTTHEVVDPLYNRDDIAGFLPDTIAYSYDTSLEVREVYYGNITGNKIAYGYDYADKDPDIMPFTNAHGTHVAGIIGGKDDTITGVAVDTQFAIMKVFSDYRTGAKDDDILAALEDSVILGVDAINMSLGSSCGFSREVDNDYKNDIYDRIEQAGISLVVAASNDYNSGFGSEQGNTNKTDNPDSATVGSPSTYSSAMSVASINGNMDKYMMTVDGKEIFFDEAFNMAADPYDFFDMLGVSAGSPKTYEYVTVPGVGMAINYAGLDMTGKIALVRRGDISFEEKVQFAYEAGAVAIIIYNNIFGDIIMTVGNDVKIPVVSIGKDDGEMLAAAGTGVLNFNFENQAGPFMSDFSSWGPTPDLKLKPEITAHGGNILSAIPGGGYEKQSGTSMASPNMCGITVLIRQYVKERFPELDAEAVRDLVNQLCMSTATIALDQKGHAYSPRKQGAGIADIRKATTTKAYLYVDGMGKTKLELGDDPDRKGVYTMSINLKNLSDTAVSYTIDDIVMTETVSSSDPEYVAEIGYVLNNSSEYKVSGGTLNGNVVTVEAGKTATVTATITLTGEDKAYINANFENGMFVEGFLTFKNTEEKGVDLNAPFLAFYGDWGEAPIFDLDYYEVETEAHNNAIDDDDKIKADYYATTPLGTYYYDYIIPMGSYVYSMGPDDVAIPATEDKAALSYYSDCISGIYGVFAGLLRGAKEMNISIVNATTGEEVWSSTEYNCYKAHYSGQPRPYFADFRLPMVDLEKGEVFGYNNTRFVVTMTATLDWEGSGERNSKDTYSFSFYIDYEPPTVTEANFRTEYDKAQKKDRYYMDLMVYDNHYAMSVRPIMVYDYYVEKDGTYQKTFTSMSEHPVPVYQDKRGETTKVTVEITDYLDLVKKSDMPEGMTIYIDDYAMNSGIYYIPFPETDNDELEFVTPTLDMDQNETFDLTTYMIKDDVNSIDAVYLKNLTWESSDPEVVAIHSGRIEALKEGTATIRVTGSSWTYTETVGGKKTEKQLYKTIVINVSDKVVENPDSAMKAQIEKLEFRSYDTLFAFPNDIDFSEIGVTGTTQFFDGNYSISCYPDEKVKLNYVLEPWNMASERYTLQWSSSNPKVATVDENGVVTAQAEGKARINLQITIDGKTSVLAARCSINVKSEFIIESRTLVAYKGKGGPVEIPDDEGIMKIGAFAFSYFDLDNKKEVEKDEDGNYDFDDKKTPLGNNRVESVIIPDGVDTIEKYAFYNCDKLSDVVLPESCETIEKYAFYGCDVLENINLDKVKIISDYAFTNCDSLTCNEYGGINLSGTHAIGTYAFAGTRLKSVALTNLSLCGESAFADCTKLETVTLGKRTRVAPKMFEKSALKSIVVYSDTIGDAAFKDCKKLTSVELQGALTYLGKEAFANCTLLSTVAFNGVCEEISTRAFYKCTALTEVTLPNSETIIGDEAFASSGIKKLVLAENTVLESIGAGALLDTVGVTVDASKSTKYVLESDGAIYSTDKTKLVWVLPSVNTTVFVVPADVVEIGDGAFSANNHVSNVGFANGSKLERIGNSAFAYCIGLKGVALPNRNVTIGSTAFYSDKLLTEVNLEKVTYVGEFAFTGTSVASANLASENVKLDYGAFSGCESLKTVVLGKGAIIGDFAFADSSALTGVSFLGDNVTVSDGAFAGCVYLKNFDFEKISGKVGDHAFYLCVSLTNVDMPHVTELGVGSFADCVGLSTFKADSLEVIGNNAFARLSEQSNSGATFKSVYLPALREIGNSAFFGCIYLEEIDISNVEKVSHSAFALCYSLKKVVMSEKVKEIGDFAFFQSSALTDIDLSNVVRIGEAAFYQVPLPATLNLDNVEEIGSQAFVEAEGMNYIERVHAPKLTQIADQAFAGCRKLVTVYAPKLESIGYGCFALTAITEFEISPNLNKVEYGIFDGNENLKALYATVDGNKVYDVVFDNVRLVDGVLYTETPNGYILVVYPSAKEDKVFTVADETVRIEYIAAAGNKFIERVELPASLRSIGNYAFYECDNLKTVVFHSYYAPELEGTMTGDRIEITPETVDQYPGFDVLYRFDYYYRISDVVAIPFYYNNFVDVIGSTGAEDITYIIPDNCEGYDSLLYRAYFKPSEETSGETVGRYAIAFIEAVKNLPEVVDRFDKKLIDAAVNAFNALEGHSEEMKFVSEELIKKFTSARSEYNISVTENKINHLFDLDCSEYSFNIVKDARAAFLALSAEEQAKVTNAARLESKIAELAEVMQVEVNFDLTFAEHFPENGGNGEPGDDSDTDTDDIGGNDEKPGLIVFILIGVAAVAVIAVVAVVLMKKKKPAVAAPVEESEAPAEAASTESAPTEESETTVETTPAESAEEAAESSEENDENKKEND